MKVLKFGGTSVGSVQSILSLKRIVENEAKRQPVIVVVSALSGITDKLISTAMTALGTTTIGNGNLMPWSTAITR